MAEVKAAAVVERKRECSQECVSSAATAAEPPRKRQRQEGEAAGPCRPYKRWAKHSLLYRDAKATTAGVLVTYPSHNAGRAVPEVMELLNRFAVQLYGPPPPVVPASATAAAASVTATAPLKDKEVDKAKDEEGTKTTKKKKEEGDEEPSEVGAGGQRLLRRFQVCNSGTEGLFAVRFVDKALDPYVLVSTIIASIREHPAQFKIRGFCRMLPIESFVNATQTNITAEAGKIITKHFSPAKPEKFAVLYQARNNENVKRDEIIKAIAQQVLPPHVVDLKNPTVCIVVEIFKSACAFSVLRNYYEERKYNLKEVLQQVSGAKPGEAVATAESKKKEQKEQKEQKKPQESAEKEEKEEKVAV
eukprot:TRINITY_DN17597_c0_g1_i1.p1 TRINITY_DN17597_c0_g1~~TRINITY_DN17597_c0_g1_i1.p1  ORF type:complete len:370 (+),score=133.83 TRINITY_DN17597_c0_g1_i1:31-1110(+)